MILIWSRCCGLLILGCVLVAMRVGVARAGFFNNEPVSDAIVTSGYVNGTGNLVVDGSTQSVIKFSTSSITGPVTSATLSLEPTGLPLSNIEIQVYAYPSTSSTIDQTDYNGGTLVTLWYPQLFVFHNYASANVTAAFDPGFSSPYIAFNLRTNSGGHGFYSLESRDPVFHDGQPFLTVNYEVPEPAQAWLILAMAVPLRTRRSVDR